MGVLSNGQVVGISRYDDDPDDGWYDVDTTTPSRYGIARVGAGGPGRAPTGSPSTTTTTPTWWTTDGDELWRLNPSDPDSTAGIYGEVEDLPAWLDELR